MTGRTHLGIGLLAGTLAPIAGLSGPEGVLAWAALAVGAMAPDLDGGGLVSKPSAWFPQVVPVPAVADRIGRAVSRSVRKVFGHRGFLHYPILVAFMAALAAYFQITWLAWLAVGYATHLLADSLTKGGIPIFGPLSSKRYGLLPRAWRIAAGGRIEALLAAIVWIGFLALLLVSMLDPMGLLRRQRQVHDTFLPAIYRGR